MKSLQENMLEYRQQLAQGAIQAAYQGLMQYLLDLKTHFKIRFPDDFVSGGLYSGYMDMSYFSVIPASLKQRNLKIAIVFLHEAFRFEAWLAGYNKQVQTHYWQFFKNSAWEKYALVPSVKGADAILVHTLVENPDFGDLDALTERIERETARFIADVEAFLESVPDE